MNTNKPLIAMVYYDKTKPLFINYIAECVKIREQLEPYPHLPHRLKIKVLEIPKPFINKL